MSRTTGTQTSLLNLWGLKRDLSTGSSPGVSTAGDVPISVASPDTESPQVFDAIADSTENSPVSGTSDAEERDSKFIVTLRVGSHQLKGLLPERPSQHVPDKETQTIHPFFLKAKSIKERKNLVIASGGGTEGGPSQGVVVTPGPISETAEVRGLDSQEPILKASESKESKESGLEAQVSREPESREPEPKKPELHASEPLRTPNLHPFFAGFSAKSSENRKRNTESHSAGNAGQKRARLKQENAPFPVIQHVRGLPDIAQNHSVKVDIIPKGKTKSKSVYIPSNVYVYLKYLDLDASARPPVKQGERLLLSGSAITKLAYNTIHPENVPRLRYLINTCGQPKAFDRFSCEDQMWSAKYSPKRIEAVATAGPSAHTLFQWIHKKQQKLKKKAAGKKVKAKQSNRASNEMDDFIVDDIDDEELTEDDLYTSQEESADFIVVHGPPGSGKTASVQAVAAELDAFLFELNSSQRRTGKEIASVLEKVGESHSIYSANASANMKSRRDALIFLEEVDSLFEEERSFWPAVTKFAEVTRRPIIMSCNDLNCIPPSVADNCIFLEFNLAEKSLAEDCLLLIALNEGHLIARSTARSILEKCQGDLRQAINTLQLHCQIGIGWRLSGVEWFINEEEKREFKNSGETVRLICKETPSAASTNISEVQTNGRESPNSQSLDAFVEQLDLLSDADVLQSNIFSQIPSDTVPSLDNTIDFIHCSEVSKAQRLFDFEIDIGEYLSGCLKELNEALPLSQKETNLSSQSIRDALSFFTAAGTFGGTGYNSIDCSTIRALCTEIGPLLRAIARTDMERRALRESQSNLNDSTASRRQSKRSLTARGILVEDEYLGEDAPLDEIVSSGPNPFLEDIATCSVIPLQ